MAPMAKGRVARLAPPRSGRERAIASCCGGLSEALGSWRTIGNDLKVRKALTKFDPFAPTRNGR